MYREVEISNDEFTWKKAKKDFIYCDYHYFGAGDGAADGGIHDAVFLGYRNLEDSMKQILRRLGAVFCIVLLAGCTMLTAAAADIDNAVLDTSEAQEPDGGEDAGSVVSDEDKAQEADTEPVSGAVALEELDFLMPSGVFVGTIDISGKTGSQVKELIEAYAAELQNRSITFCIGELKEVMSVSDLGCEWSNEAELAQRLDATQQGSLIDQYKAYKDITDGDEPLAVDFSFDTESMDSCMQALKDEYNTEALNATVTRVDGQFIITDSVDGLVIDEDSTKDALLEAVKNWNGESISITVDAVESKAEVTSDMFEGFGALLGTCTTTYWASNSIRNGNVEKAASNMDGWLFLADEDISCLDMIAPVTVEGGYGLAPSYVSGKQVDSIGGGICQVATTLYGAYLEAEIEIVYRKNHSASVDYVDPSMDATIYPESGLDLKAKNNTGSPIYIEAYTSDGKVTINIYGVEYRPENRTVKYRSIITSIADAGIESDLPDESMQVGTVTYLNIEHKSMTSQLWKDVYVDGVLEESTMINSDTYYPMPANRRYGAPVDANGTQYYVRDDGYVVAMEDKDNPDAVTYRLNPDGTWLDDPLGDDEDDDDDEDEDDSDSKSDKSDGNGKTSSDGKSDTTTGSSNVSTSEDPSEETKADSEE